MNCNHKQSDPQWQFQIRRDAKHKQTTATVCTVSENAIEVTERNLNHCWNKRPMHMSFFFKKVRLGCLFTLYFIYTNGPKSALP